MSTPYTDPPEIPLAELIDGRALSAQIRAEVKEDVAAWIAQGNRAPFLTVVLVGDNPASASYVRGKEKASREVGIGSETLRYSADISEAELLQVIADLNANSDVDGILVQLPLPNHIDDQKVIYAIDPDKDVDGFHPVSLGRLMIGLPGFLPATPAGIMEMLYRSDVETKGKRAVVLGRSNIVGKPMANLLLQRGTDATVTVCHSRTTDLKTLTRGADILIAAIGRANFVTADMVKEGAAVIDVGINRVEDASRTRGYRLVGDVDFDAVSEKAACITPVPGGVGPMTIAMLLKNTLAAAKGTF